MDRVILVGAEDVRSAGHTMSSAADAMRRAASHMDDSMERHHRVMDQSLTEHANTFAEAADKFARAIGALAEIEGMKAENQHRVLLGLGVSYGDAAFWAVGERYGLEVKHIAAT